VNVKCQRACFAGELVLCVTIVGRLFALCFAAPHFERIALGVG